MLFKDKPQPKTSWRSYHGKVPVPTKADWNIIRSRFANNSFVTMVESNLQKNNWIDYDYYNGGIKVYEDKIITKSKTYRYCDYNLSNLDMESCWELACWLIDFLPAGTQGTIQSIKDDYYHPGTSYIYETPGGHLAHGDTSSYGEVRVGYMIFKADTYNNTNQNKKPSMNW